MEKLPIGEKKELLLFNYLTNSNICDIMCTPIEWDSKKNSGGIKNE